MSEPLPLPLRSPGVGEPEGVRLCPLALGVPADADAPDAAAAGPAIAAGGDDAGSCGEAAAIVDGGAVIAPSKSGAA